MTKNIKTQVSKYIGRSLNSYRKLSKPIIDEVEYREKYQGKIIDCLVGEVDDNYIETPETDASIVTLEHSKEGVIKLPTIKGKTIATESGLVSVGEEPLIFNVTNKNIWNEESIKTEEIIRHFDFNTFENKRCISNPNKRWLNLTLTNNIIFKENTVYTLFFKYKNTERVSSGTGVYIDIVHTDGTLHPAYTNFDNGWQTCFRSSEPGKTVSHLVLHDVANCKTYIDLDSIIIVEGETRDYNYIAPKRNRIEVALSEPLIEGNIISGNKIIKKYHKLILNDGSGVGRYEPGDSATHYRYTITLDRVAGSLPTKLDGKIPINSYGWPNRISSRENCIYLHQTTNAIHMFILKEMSDGTIHWFINYLAENPLEVVYEIRTPIEIDLTNSINLQGYDNSTINIENSLIPKIVYGYNALIPLKEAVKSAGDEVDYNTADINDNIIPYLMDIEHNLMIMEDI